MDGSLNRTRIGVIAGSVGLFCALMGGAVPGYPAAAAEPAAAAAETGKRFATVWRVRGEVTASAPDGKAGNGRKLREGDPVYVGEQLRAAALAEAVLKTADGGFVAIRPRTEFVTERFAAEDKPTDSLALRLITGSLRVVTGWIARTNRSGYRLATPSATIGIRGTDHEPYVLSAELAEATANREGTYDKVNRGGTTMEAGENKLDINPGQVGFVRAPTREIKGPFREKALMTLLLPVLLDKVPNFYVPGEFDAELDRHSQTADQDSLRQLEQRRRTQGAAPAAAPVVAPVSAPPTAPAVAPIPAPLGEPQGKCAPAGIAKAWLGQLDSAIARRDARSIVAMFAPEAAIRATVRGNDGNMTSVDLGREELAQSTLAALKGLKGYKQRRVWIEGKLANPAAAAACDRISLRSVVIEQGRQSGKPYRFESLEQYLLELRAGKWLAIKAETTQQ